MDTTARRYARRILLTHAALLAVVLGTVAVAARQVYRGTRDEVIRQAEGRQRMLAAQTAQGIENHYASILNDMDLLRRANMETEASTTQPAAAATPAERALSRVLSGGGRNPGGTQVIGGVMWRQLQGRATVLFSTERAPATRPTTGRQPAGPIGFNRSQQPGSRLIGTDDPKVTPDLVMAGTGGAWVRGQRSPSVGEFGQWGDVAGNLVCIPLREEAVGGAGQPFRFGGRGGGPRRTDAGSGPPPASPDGRPAGDPPSGDRPAGDRLPDDEGPPPPGDEPARGDAPTARSAATPSPGRSLVAVVPIAKVEHDFLKPLGDDPSTGAWLIDQRWMAMAASRPGLVGANMASLTDAGLEALARKYIMGHAAGCEVIDRSFQVGRVTFAPAMVAAEPVDIADRHWELFVATSLETVDGTVGELFRRAVWWGGGVAMAVALILASTALGLIRGRVRVERLRHEVLTREVEQARQIQLAWLPTTRPAGDVDVAAVNSPASHISGDFYNWFDLPDGRLAITIGDVTGHGMAAAFLMATTQLLVRTTLARVADPGACLTEVNRQLCIQAFNGQFVTMLVAVLDPAARRLHVATAGHPSPLLVAERGGATHPLPIEPQLVLAVECDAEYPTETHDLPPGAALVLYTDGVVECPAGAATANAGQRFGTDRLRSAVQSSETTTASARGLVDGVVAAVDAFRGPRELDDDLTVVAVQLRSASGSGVGR